MVRAGVVLPGDESLVVSDTELCGTIRIRQLMQNFFEKLRFLHDCIVKSVHVVCFRVYGSRMYRAGQKR